MYVRSAVLLRALLSFAWLASRDIRRESTQTAVQDSWILRLCMSTYIYIASTPSVIDMMHLDRSFVFPFCMLAEAPSCLVLAAPVFHGLHA